MDKTITLIAQILRSAHTKSLIPIPKELRSDFYSEVAKHGLASLLEYHLQHSQFKNSWPSEILNRLKKHSRDQCALELAYEKELKEILASFDIAGIKPLLMKGTPLAYTHYPAFGLRPHCDTDMLIRKQDISSVFEIMKKHGYHYFRVDDLLTRQISFTKKMPLNIKITLDVHWRVNNRPLFINTLTYKEIIKDCIPIQELGKNARTLKPVHALILACMHRAAEGAFGSNEKLIWLYDIHLLLSSFSEDEFKLLIELVIDKKILLICIDAITRSIELYNTNIPEWFLENLPTKHVIEPSSRLLLNNAPRYQFNDIYKVPRLINKIDNIYEALFPPSIYVLRYKNSNKPFLLPYYYLQRYKRIAKSIFN